MPTATTPETVEDLKTVTSPDGTTIAYERTGSGPALVLVHGAALDRTFWDIADVRSELAEGHTVYAIDRRGRGPSGDADAYDLDREIEDVTAVVESIDEPVTLLGHSYGALVALEVALRSDDLDGLVLFEPPFGPDIPPEIEQLYGTIRALVDDGEREAALLTNLTAVGTPEASLEALRSSPNWPGLVDAAETIPREYEGFMAYEFDPERFDEMTTPTVLLTGEESHPSLVALSETVDETLPNSRIVVFEGHGHFAMNTAPDRFVDEVRAFVQESH